MRKSYYKPRPAREITCERCGAKFLVKGAGHSRDKYCVECKVEVYEENQKKRDKKRKRQRTARLRRG